MIKRTVVTQTIAAANALLADLQNGIAAETTTLDKWSGALIRYVFYHNSERTHAQDIENMVEEITRLDLSEASDRARAIELLPLIVADIEEEAATAHLNGKIEWEPPFDRGLLREP